MKKCFMTIASIAVAFAVAVISALPQLPCRMTLSRNSLGLASHSTQITTIEDATTLTNTVAFAIIAPRALTYMMSGYLTAVDNEPATYFTEYSAEPDFESITVDNEKFSVSIPENFTHKDTGEVTSLNIYISPDEEHYEFIMLTGIEGEEVNLLNPETYTDSENIPENIDIEEVGSWFEKLGHGLPNSTYNTFKCIALLERDDFSFCDLEQSVAFVIMGMFKEILYYEDYEYVYIYERDDICGIIQIKRDKKDETNFDGYKVTFEFFSTDDLNKSYTLMMGMQSLDDIYAIVNSVEIL